VFAEEEVDDNAGGRGVSKARDAGEAGRSGIFRSTPGASGKKPNGRPCKSYTASGVEEVTDEDDIVFVLFVFSGWCIIKQRVEGARNVEATVTSN
jgi:hypothetical protein